MAIARRCGSCATHEGGGRAAVEAESNAPLLERGFHGPEVLEKAVDPTGHTSIDGNAEAVVGE